MNTSIKLNKKFYSIRSINQAIKDFNNIASFLMSENNDYVSVKITTEKEVDSIKYEFYNYILSLMKNEALV